MTVEEELLPAGIGAGVAARDAICWYPKSEAIVQCRNCPRQCILKPGQIGFCKVRVNIDGVLRTFSYGRALDPGYEPIETEAVYEFFPGTRCLMVGNIGCTLDCAWCQNWVTARPAASQFSSFLSLTPQAIASLARSLNVPVLSFTYNDFAAAPEYLVDIARLVRPDINTLYKTALYQSTDALAYVIPHIDIYSISLKTADPQMFKRFCKGELPAVYDAILFIYRRAVLERGAHLELSNLLVTDLNDSSEQVKRVVGWILRHLGPSVPLHFVRSHPARAFQAIPRTPISRLERAYELAKDMGMQRVYLGNVGDHRLANTYCEDCGSLLIRRPSPEVELVGIDSDGRCQSCGASTGILMAPTKTGYQISSPPQDFPVSDFSFPENCLQVHLRIKNHGEQNALVHWLTENHSEAIDVPPGQVLRISIARTGANPSVSVAHGPAVEVKCFPVLDRAHYTTATGNTGANGVPDDLLEI